jgi:hypothetical protein
MEEQTTSEALGIDETADDSMDTDLMAKKTTSSDDGYIEQD